MTRRGWTLLELLVVLLIATILAALVSSVVAAAARAATRQASALDRERSQLAITAWWRAGLRDSESGDVAVPANDRVVAHHPVGAGVPCRLAGAELWIARAGWRGTRDPEPGRDEAWLLVDVVAAAWDEVAIVAVGSGSCPGGEPALRLALSSAVVAVQLVRVVEPVQLRIYRSGFSWWLGLAPADGSSPVQPFAGPVDPAASGFSRDTSGVRGVVQSASGRVLRLLAPLYPP